MSPSKQNASEVESSCKEEIKSQDLVEEQAVVEIEKQYSKVNRDSIFMLYNNTPLLWHMIRLAKSKP